MSDSGLTAPSFETSDIPVGDTGNGEVNTGTQNGHPVGEDLSLASPFLSKIPASDRQIVGRYVKDWDAGVTKRFQDYSSRIKPYEALGSVEELRNYATFVNNFRTNPEAMFKLMWEGLQEQYGDQFQQELHRILQLEEEMLEEEGYGSDEGKEQETPGFDPNEQFQQNVMQELEELRAWRSEFEQSQEDAVGQAQLDSVIQQMHTQYGQFDDNFILLQLSQHGNVEQAIQAWQQMLGQYSSPTPQRSAPKIMGGQGGVPSGQVNTEQLRGKDRREMVANMLANLEQ
jgi:hypothetical protein